MSIWKVKVTKEPEYIMVIADDELEAQENARRVYIDLAYNGETDDRWSVGKATKVEEGG